MYSALSIAPNNPLKSDNIHTDIRIFTAHGVHAKSIVSAIPSNTGSSENRKILNQAIPTSFIDNQIDIAMEDHQVRTWKISELSSTNSINEVVASIRNHDISSVVFNPVLTNAGNEAYSDEIIDALVLDLLPLSKLVVLSKNTALQLIDSFEESKPARVIATELHEMGANGVFIVDIPDENSFEYVDIFFDGNETTEIRSPIIAANIKTGLVSTLSTSITAYIARGMQLEQAVQSGREYLAVVLASSGIDAEHTDKFGLNHTLNRMIISEATGANKSSGNDTTEIENLSKYLDMIEDETAD